jgi:ABC-type glycerol-3-phosphate transport system substrate-binding protein
VREKRKGENKMKHLLTRVALMILIIAMCISMAACGGSGSNVDNSSGSNTGSAAQAGDKKESVELTLWHSFSAGVSQGVIDKFIEKYEKENPNIKIKQETAQIEEYQF